METLRDALKFTTLKSVAIVLLLAIHSMRSPSGTSTWHLSGLAIRQCLELGLHRTRKSNDQDLDNEQHRIRMFWSVYIFERKTALVLGRPFALSDDDIELDLPANDCVELSMANDVDRPTNDEVSPATTLSFHQFHIQLYQIHGQIRRLLRHVRESVPRKSIHEVESLLNALDAWRHQMLETYSTEAQCVHDRSRRVRGLTEWYTSGRRGPTLYTGYQTTHPGRQRSIDVERSELLLEHHKAKRTLLQALMIEGRGHFPFSKVHFLACANASGQICQLYRRLHRLRSTPFTLRDLHAVFVAGFTLVYCIFSYPEVPPAESASDLGACSTVLYVITEQWPGAKRYRDAFEMVTEKLREYTANTQGDHHPSASAKTYSASIISSPPARNAPLATAEWYHTGSSTQPPFPSTPQTNPSAFEADGLVFPTAGPDLLELDTDFQKLLADVGLDWFNDVPNNLGAQ
ncbi:hypothetical protein KC332_g9096 [Hortaea werneckii]|uniref:Xylanolytic transcriptional activator regulatory domain-containing protein n=2 Tax=Hortaea werneckii TaxID=91943 RepID=A0A3M7IS54_HORWE|nr:hypothetical protein KC358_g9966 [Hortaea werneckii]OTA26523.1 hypothetical protein BTJ68_11622 [Hortaea werneckii EXF-2000]KAI6825518.1 hypothetical protein KC350_g8761 [Hortaea werneckii]KAI6921548.1 hypothetical protein KC348_g10104 [Hortaea werneckii]KAI6931323.1 hypothetical protein KC341_g9675 [Hortaea werneckii]